MKRIQIVLCKMQIEVLFESIITTAEMNTLKRDELFLWGEEVNQEMFNLTLYNTNVNNINTDNVLSFLRRFQRILYYKNLV